MQKIDRKGVYSIPMDVYHSQCCAGPSISSSGLRTIFTKSPAHYWCKSELNPERVEDDDEAEKGHFILGRAAHHLLLGEDAFSTLFVCRPAKAPDGRDWNGNNNTCKEWLARQREAGRTVITPTQVDAIRGMAKSLSQHPLVISGILNGDIEKSLIWRDKETGIYLKSRPDAIPNDSGDGADLKTSSASGDDLDNEIFKKYRYDIQGALTKWAFKEVLDLKMESFSFVFVDVKAPWCADVLTLTDEDLAEAEKDLRQALRTFAWCLEHNNWFGPSGTQSDARYAHKSDYAKERATYRREFLQREIGKAEEVTKRYSEAEYLGA